MLGDPVLHLDRGPSRGSHSQRFWRAPASFGLKKPVVAITLVAGLRSGAEVKYFPVHQSLMPR